MKNENPEEYKRYPDLGKVSIAILEALVEPILGKDTIQELKIPVIEEELQRKLEKTLEYTEKRFIAEHEDKSLCVALMDLSISNLPSIQMAIRGFYYHPADPKFEQQLNEKFTSDYSFMPQLKIQKAVKKYLDILRQELVSISPDIREKLNAIILQDIQRNIGRMADSIEAIRDVLPPGNSDTYRTGNAPPLPSLIVGRNEELIELRNRLQITSDIKTPTQVLTAIKGWPGVGKTTIASALAHDVEIQKNFPDGVLWVSLGLEPDLFYAVALWGRVLGTDELLHAPTLKDAQAQLAALLLNKRMLLIIDDVWEIEHAMPFNVGGRNCATLITTRLDSVARKLAPTAENIYRLGVLSDNNAMKLLRELAPTIVMEHPNNCLMLVQELEGLPLALQVAGRLLNAEASYGFGVAELITELREGAKLLRSQAPADRIDLAQQTTPTIAALLYKSVERLNDHTRNFYAYLGVFAPKPATFNLRVMKSIWDVEDPKPIVQILVDRGLIEYIPETDCYQMHALLVMLAKSLLTEE